MCVYVWLLCRSGGSSAVSFFFAFVTRLEVGEGKAKVGFGGRMQRIWIEGWGECGGLGCRRLGLRG